MKKEEFKALCYESKVARIIDAPEDFNLPEEATYIAQYLRDYRPVLPPVQHPDNETSVDIADTLSSLGYIKAATVSRVMTLLGYRLVFQGISQPVWAMEYTPTE